MFPNGMDGGSDVNYIYMMAELKSAKPQTIKVAVHGDDIFSLFSKITK